VIAVVAPGKAILCGEYAVLHGAPAVSVAVDRVVRARAQTGANPTPFITAAIRRTTAELLAAGASPTLISGDAVSVDSSALYEGHQKIGLGSSAAVTVAVTGAVFASAGLPLDDRRRLFRLADEAHTEAQGTRGSGIDVATAVWRRWPCPTACS
jgi:phosphomevalonate kinase